MPYSRLSRGTDAHHEYVLTDSPWLEDFLEICVHPNDDTFSSNQQLFDCYQRYIRFKDLTAQVNDIASGRRRFFNSLARWRRQNPGKLVQVNCNKAKGYNVWLFKMPRRCAVPELTSTSEEMKTYVATPLEERPVLVHRRYVSENIGYGAFAKDTIPSGTVVTEYFGHTVDAVTAIQRDDEYKARGLPAAMFMVGRNQFVDPYDPQCVIKAIDNQGKKLFLYSFLLCCIFKNMQFYLE